MLPKKLGHSKRFLINCFQDAKKTCNNLGNFMLHIILGKYIGWKKNSFPLKILGTQKILMLKNIGEKFVQDAKK